MFRIKDKTNNMCVNEEAVKNEKYQGIHPFYSYKG